jgi:hypothetical protein
VHSAPFLAVKRRLDELIHPPMALADEDKIPMVRMTNAEDEIE